MPAAGPGAEGRPPSRWERLGAFPAAGAVIALFAGNLLVGGTLNARPVLAAALQLVLLAVFVAYCVARPHGGALLAVPVVGGGLLVGVLVSVAPLLGVLAALALLVASFVVASRLDDRDDRRRARAPGAG